MTITLDTLTLPDALLWQDEFSWPPACGSAKRTLMGRVKLHEAAISGESGRPITLGNAHAWITRANLLTLRDWSLVRGKRMLLTLHDGATRPVAFRHHEGPVIEAAPVVEYSDPEAGDRYQLLQLKLVVV